MNKYSKYIIDTHVHVSRSPYALFRMPEEWIIGAMDKYGIDFSLVSNGDCTECDHEQVLMDKRSFVSQEDALIADIDFARRYPGKIGLCVWIRPRTQGYTKELENIITENRDIIYGLKIHPYHSNMAPDDVRVKPYLDMASRLKLTVVSHTASDEVDSVRHLYNAAKEYPDIAFIMAHMGLGTDNEEALKYLGMLDNLYGDTTWVPLDTTLKALRLYGSKKILFGSDLPIDGLDTYWYNRKHEPSMYREYFDDLCFMIGNDAFDDIMYKNAKRIFGIEL